jgi:hypothetical protein
MTLRYPLPLVVIGASLVRCATVLTGRVGVEWSPMTGTSQKTLPEGITGPIGCLTSADYGLPVILNTGSVTGEPPKVATR